MKKIRHLLVIALGLNMVIAIASKWHIVSKISVIVNATALTAAVFFDLIMLAKNRE